MKPLKVLAFLFACVRALPPCSTNGSASGEGTECQQAVDSQLLLQVKKAELQTQKQPTNWKAKFTNAKKTCKNTRLEVNRNAKTEASCKSACLANEQCHGVFLVTQPRHRTRCVLYADCDTTRTTKDRGNTYVQRKLDPSTTTTTTAMKYKDDCQTFGGCYNGMRIRFPKKPTDKPTDGWPTIIDVNKMCNWNEFTKVALCVEPLGDHRNQKTVDWLEMVVPSLRKRAQELEINPQRIGVYGYSWGAAVAFYFAAAAIKPNPKSGSEVNGIMLISSAPPYTHWLNNFAKKSRGKPPIFQMECTKRKSYQNCVDLHKELQKREWSSTLLSYQCPDDQAPWYHHPMRLPQYRGDMHRWITVNMTSMAST